VEVYAFAFVQAVPAFPDEGDGSAVEETGDGEGDSLCDDDGHEDKDRLSHLLTWEDAEAEEQERNLCQCDGDEVEHFGQPCELGNVSPNS